ncbi:PREDICTED: S-type anion channel SLAH3-like [Nicotiana attenuata]|uniref:S-type anion channel SLAH3-like n=1 Tax=Nicotiana attenuata TaxID=49451 RepID=UPI000904F8B2|nr:PREDICTED: S-type anion channel SLAH3-like [Nicotiana attenuata]
MSGGQRRLSKVPSPVNHLSVVGNFVGALLGASMGLEEGPIFFYAVGLAHYLVLFVTLYQRLLILLLSSFISHCFFVKAVRINFFRGFRFSLAWWAYTFPMTGVAIATVRYSTAAANTVTKCLAIILCSLATLTVTALLVTTIIYAFVLRDLFPNDISIAISERRHKTIGL